MLAALAVLSCCGGLNQWLLAFSTAADRATIGIAVADLVEGRAYPIYADLPGVDELRCRVGEYQFERELVIRRSDDAPLWRATASGDDSPELPFFGWLHSDRSEYASVDCSGSTKEPFLLTDHNRPLWILLGATVLALLLAVAALVAAVLVRRRPPAGLRRRPSLRWLLAAPALLVGAFGLLVAAAIGYGPAALETNHGPEIGAQPTYGQVSVLTYRGTRYLVYQAAGDGGPATDCPAVDLDDDPPLGVPATVTHVGTEFRYIGSFRGAGHTDVGVDCAGDAPLMVRTDRRPLAVLALAGSAFLLAGVAALGLVLVILISRRRARGVSAIPGV
jgi:hypothetical protein